MGEVPETETSVSVEIGAWHMDVFTPTNPEALCLVLWDFYGGFRTRASLITSLASDNGSNLQPHPFPRGQRDGTESSNPIVMGYSVNHPHFRCFPKLSLT